MVFSNISKLKSILLCAAEVWLVQNDRKNQSPINIVPEVAVPREYPPLKFTNYENRLFLELKNTGNHLEIKYDYDEMKERKSLPTISCGVLRTEYILDHIRYHWPSEHVKRGTHYPIEGHFVHYKKCKGSFSNAVNSGDMDAICIVSVLYDVVEVRPNKYLKDCLDHIVDKIKCIKVYKPDNSTVTNHQVKLCGLMPKHKCHYYSYFGSLTNEPFPECVIWIIFDEHAKIRRYQYEKLVAVQDAAGKDHIDRIRMLQELGDRKIVRVTSVVGADVDKCNRYEL